MSYNTATPYIASYVLLRRGNRIAFLLREHTESGWMNGYYGLVAGRVEKKESFQAAAIRETKEEAGVDVKTSQLKHVLTVHRYEPSSHATEWVDVYFEALTWEGEPKNNQSDQHSELAWLDLDNLPDNVIPSVRFALDQIKQGKVYSEYGWER